MTSRLRQAEPHKERMCTKAPSARRPRYPGFLTALGVSAVALCAAPALADEPAREEAAEKKDDAGKKEAPPNDPREDPLTRYYFLGARARAIVMPQFMLEIFTTGGGTGTAWLVGPEFTTRKNGTEIDISLAYADYGFGPAMFKGKDDPDIAYEVVKSDMKIAYLTFDLLFDFPIGRSGMFSFLIGGGIGVGVVAGDLSRVQAYPKDGGAPDPSDPTKWDRCTAVGDGFGGYCDNGNSAFYNPTTGKDYSEPSWIDGGSKPVILPWLSIPQISFRAKPIKQLQMRADVGFSITGFFFGFASGYGF
jgi:hypothetical protein